KGDHLGPRIGTLSPNKKIPAIVDMCPDPAKFGKGPLTITESAAIMQYLAGDKVISNLYPQGRARVETNEWLYFQISSVGPMMGQLNWFRHAPEHIPLAIKRYEDEVSRLLNVLEKRLSHVEYLNGHDYSIADIANFCWVKRAYVPMGDYPMTRAWIEKISAREAVWRGLEVAAGLHEM
ncbi:hypothetical protein HK102_007717, partial [Quaeritorhiza haematococci]